MKWILLIASALLLTGCGYTTTEVVEYREVVATPVVEPVYFGPAGTIDVTTTSIDYY